MEVEIKDDNKNILSSFYLPVVIEGSSKENITSENTPNYIEEMQSTINDLQNQATQLLRSIKTNGDETISEINDNYSAIVNDVNTLLNNYTNIQENISNHIDNRNNPHEVTKEQLGLQNALLNNSDIKDTKSTFTQSTSRTNIATGEKLSTIFGKIAKYFADLKNIAFSRELQ